MPSNLSRALVVMARYRPEFAIQFALDPSSVDPEMFDAEFAKLPEEAKDDLAFGQAPDVARETHALNALGIRFVKAIGQSDDQIRTWSAALLVLGARGIDVTPEAHMRIIMCDDLEQLEVWARRAATVDTVDELFDV